MRNPNLEPLLLPEIWAQQNCFGVPPEITAVPHGATITLKENPDKKHVKSLVMAHPVGYSPGKHGPVPYVTPDDVGSHQKQHLVVPGVYEVLKDQDCSVRFLDRPGHRISSYVKGKWTIIRCIKPAKGIGDKGKVYAFFQGGQRPLIIEHLEIET